MGLYNRSILMNHSLGTSYFAIQDVDTSIVTVQSRLLIRPSKQDYEKSYMEGVP